MSKKKTTKESSSVDDTQKQQLILNKLFGTELQIKDNILLINFGDLPSCKWFKVPGIEGLFIKISDSHLALDIISGVLKEFHIETQVLGIKKVNLYLN